MALVYDGQLTYYTHDTTQDLSWFTPDIFGPLDLGDVMELVFVQDKKLSRYNINTGKTTDITDTLGEPVRQIIPNRYCVVYDKYVQIKDVIIELTTTGYVYIASDANNICIADQSTYYVFDNNYKLVSSNPMPGTPCSGLYGRIYYILNSKYYLLGWNSDSDTFISSVIDQYIVTESSSGKLLIINNHYLTIKTDTIDSLEPLDYAARFVINGTKYLVGYENTDPIPIKN